MSFIESLFLFFLPAALIPLLIAFIFNINRKIINFPSIELLKEIFKQEPASKRILMKLKHILLVISNLHDHSAQNKSRSIYTQAVSRIGFAY